jgi:electron transfer flavoprotein beta subunit
MNILVCISNVPDTTARIQFSQDGKKLDESGIQFILNPYDEWYALVRAIELKEKTGGKVVVINIGPASNDIIIRKALAIGADEAVRVNAEAKDAWFVANQIAEYVKSNPFDLVFTGKETIDHNGSEVGAMVAELLEWPFFSHAIHLEFQGEEAHVTCDIGGGQETYGVNGHFILSSAKGLAEQRIPNMRGIMMAKSKPLNVVEPAAVNPHTSVVKYELPPSKKEVKLIAPENMEELVRLLHEEAKLI